MPIKIAHDARPQVRTLLFAVALSVVLWFIPFAEVLTYPFRLFVTFIHEGGHALAAILTGNSVRSLTVHLNGSGEVIPTQGGLLSSLLVSSAGYLGAMTFGALLLVAVRRAIAARFVLTGSAAFILTMSFGYGWRSPFTLISGITLAAILLVAARFAGKRVASFLVSFLAVQCILNALFDLKTVFFMSTPFAPEVHTDAVNMAAATGIPAIFWTLVWVALAFVILSFALRTYAANRSTPMQEELPFEDPLEPPLP